MRLGRFSAGRSSRGGSSAGRITAVLTAAALAIGGTIGGAVSGPDVVAPAAAATRDDADAAMEAFVEAFWDPSRNYFFTYSDRRIHEEHAHGPEDGLYTDFWWEAQLWDLVMDAYERTGDQQYREMLDDVYDGFVAYYPTFENDFNDDQGWWAKGCVRAYEITGEQRYLDCAEDLFATIWAERDDVYGGGIWWRKSVRDQKNVATNATAAWTAARLYAATDDPAYLASAENLFDWVDTHLHEDGHVHDHYEGDPARLVKWDFTYNFGTYIGAATSLASVTGDETYLDRATAAADWSTEHLTNAGTFVSEGINDGGGFKPVLVRSLMTLVDEHGQDQYLPMLQANATQAWSHRRSSDDLMGPNWSAPTGDEPLQSLTAAAAVSALQVVTPNGWSGPQPGTGIHDAENGRAVGFGAESSQPGFLGRGYLAGWNADGQAVTFDVVAASGGPHELRFRYAAAAGDAVRRVLVDGAPVARTLTFAGTGSWSTWSEVVLNGVELTAGHNTVTVEYSSAAGSANWLNLDRMTVSRQVEAETGRLRGVRVETDRPGFTGTGYVAGRGAPKQQTVLPVTVTRPGAYDLTLRYAAGSGDASRRVVVNGSRVTNLRFPGTGTGAGAWSTVTVPGVELRAGRNTVSVVLTKGRGDVGHLDLDHVTLRCTTSGDTTLGDTNRTTGATS
jgi:predicted alpha-1,6-mannanase (GH76 family)